MAMGRMHGSSDRHDRLLGIYCYANGHVPITDQPDLCEDDIWLMSSSGQASNGTIDTRTGSEPRQTNLDQSTQTRHWTRTDHRHVGGLSLAFEDRYGTSPTRIHQYRSMDRPTNRHAAATTAAPTAVNVPNWPKTVRVDSGDSISCLVELDRDEFEWVPPHVYRAREHGRTVTTSVFEGVGRTLKGRDMSRVREVVWSKTGFFG